MKDHPLRTFFKRRSIRVVVPCLMLGSIATVTVLGWSHQSNSAQSFRYPFTRPHSHEAIQQVQSELTFLQNRALEQPNDGLVRAELAQAYFKMAKATGDTHWYLQAEQTAQRSRTQLPFNNAGATLVLASVAEAKHDFATSIQLANQILDESPSHEGAISLLVTSYLAQGKLDQAEQQATQLVNQIPTLPSLMLQALVSVAQGKDTLAEQQFEHAIAAEEPGESGSSARVRVLYGKYLFERGQLQRAQSLFKSALNISPQYPPALVNLAQLETQQGQFQKAEQRYEQVFASVASANVLDHASYASRAELYALRGETAKAKDWWNRAEAFLREHTDLSTFGHERELAKVLLVRGNQADQAEALALMQSEAQRRGDAQTLETLAWALSRGNQWQEAQAVIEKALESNVNNAQVYLRAAAIARHLNQPKLARHYQQRAEQINPHFPNSRKALLGLNS